MSVPRAWHWAVTSKQLVTGIVPVGGWIDRVKRGTSSR
jgi:hypothetical protein